VSKKRKYRPQSFEEGRPLTPDEIDQLMLENAAQCTSATRPAAPKLGWRVYETDTESFFRYDGTAWLPIQVPVKEE
jgi:hypothetical protein